MPEIGWKLIVSNRGDKRKQYYWEIGRVAIEAAGERRNYKEIWRVAKILFSDHGQNIYSRFPCRGISPHMWDRLILALGNICGTNKYGGRILVLCKSRFSLMILAWHAVLNSDSSVMQGALSRDPNHWKTNRFFDETYSMVFIVVNCCSIST